MTKKRIINNFDINIKENYSKFFFNENKKKFSINFHKNIQNKKYNYENIRLKNRNVVLEYNNDYSKYIIQNF